MFSDYQSLRFVDLTEVFMSLFLMGVKEWTFPNSVNYEENQLLKRQRKSLKKLQSPSH